MGAHEPKGAVWGQIAFWTVLAQLIYSVAVMYLDAHYAQKQWPSEILFRLVWKGHEGFSGLVDMTMQTKKIAWHVFALVQALTVGVMLDMLRKVSGITQGT